MLRSDQESDAFRGAPEIKSLWNAFMCSFVSAEHHINKFLAVLPTESTRWTLGLPQLHPVVIYVVVASNGLDDPT